MNQFTISILFLGLLLIVGPSTEKYLLVDIKDGIDDELPGTILMPNHRGIVHQFING